MQACDTDGCLTCTRVFLFCPPLAVWQGGCSQRRATSTAPQSVDVVPKVRGGVLHRGDVRLRWVRANQLLAVHVFRVTSIGGGAQLYNNPVLASVNQSQLPSQLALPKSRRQPPPTWDWLDWVFVCLFCHFSGEAVVRAKGSSSSVLGVFVCWEVTMCVCVFFLFHW